MMPTPDLEAALARLEKENRNLTSRLEKLEKQRRSSIPALIANVFLLVMAGLLANYLGLFPPPIETLPLRARTVEAQEFIIRNRDGRVQARSVVDDKGARFVGTAGKPLPERP
jgi:hypothetical protein